MFLDITLVLVLIGLGWAFLIERKKRLQRERDCVVIHEELQRSKAGATRLLQEGRKLTEWNTELQAKLQHKDAMLLDLANKAVASNKGTAAGTCSYCGHINGGHSLACAAVRR